MTRPTRGAGQALQDHVSAAVSKLQAGYLHRVPTAVADLARLRRAITSAPGADPTVWALMFENWPVELTPGSEEPTSAERAAHAALTMYAFHQQSKHEDRMHQSNRSFGRAVGELARSDGAQDGAVRRRFDAVVTASDLREVVHHGRGLVTQMRARSLSMDYGLLAKHLWWLQHADQADRARLRWARDFYPRGIEPSDNTAATDPEPAPAEGDIA